MAGGSGTRFWPLSRRHLPKQFLAIGGEHPLITSTMSRLDELTEWSHRYVVAGEHHASGVREHCPSLPHTQLLIEPCARNTAPCVALAALHIARRDPDGVMIVLPSDHHIADVDALQRALNAAVAGAHQDKIVTLGVVPTRPETGYGYIRFPGGGVINESRLEVDRFVEKPPRRLAERYLASGEYLWNSGVFIMSARRVLSEIERQLPDLHEALIPVRQALALDQTEIYHAALDEAFMQIKPVSIDVGVMEHADDVEVIPISVGWSDVGHWGALEEVSAPDERGCVLQGQAEHIILDAERVTISSNKVVAVVGVSDVIIVDTPDAALVCHRDQAQEVKRVVAELSAQGRAELT
jgi:mannose-1-phosphate guanylyltransferase